jgi:hypothetical protein
MGCAVTCINGTSTIFEFASWTLEGKWNAANPQSTCQQPLTAKMLLTILRPPSTFDP